MSHTVSLWLSHIYMHQAVRPKITLNTLFLAKDMDCHGTMLKSIEVQCGCEHELFCSLLFWERGRYSPEDDWVLPYL